MTLRLEDGLARAASRRGDNFRAVVLPAAAILASILWIYWPTLHGGWLWDDGLSIRDNALLRGPWLSRATWAVSGSRPLFQYYPLTQMALWVQWRLWGKSTTGYHSVNLLLHALNSCLVWILLRKLKARHAWLGAIAFAVHPVQVETVAWMSELKNTLSLAPFLASLCFWVDFDEEPASWRYAASFLLFVAAILCKASAVVLPAALALYAWWRHGRLRPADLARIAPFVIVSLFFGRVAAATESAAIVHPPWPPGMAGVPFRLALAARCLSFYCTHVLWPEPLMPIYPLWKIDAASIRPWATWAAFSAATAWLWRRDDGWRRNALFGAAFFIATLSPFLLVPWTYRDKAWVADHLLYIPMVGFAGLLAAAVEEFERRAGTSARRAGLAILAAILAASALRSRVYAADFADPADFWRYALSMNPNAWIAHLNLGAALLSSGHPMNALEHFDQAIRIKPDCAEAYSNSGVALMRLGDDRAALQRLSQAVAINPGIVESRINLGNFLRAHGRPDLALLEYETAAALGDDSTEAHNDYGAALAQYGRLDEAIAEFQKALRIDPDSADARRNLDQALLLKSSGPR